MVQAELRHQEDDLRSLERTARVDEVTIARLRRRSERRGLELRARLDADLLLPQGIVRACLYLENEGAGPAPLFSELDWVRSCSCGQRSLRMRMAILRAWTEHRGWNSPMHWAE